VSERARDRIDRQEPRERERESKKERESVCARKSKTEMHPCDTYARVLFAHVARKSEGV